MVYKKKFENKIFLIILVFAILSLSIVPVLAKVDHSVAIHLESAEGEPIAERRLKVWKIADDVEALLSSELGEKLSSFDTLDDAVFDDAYSHFLTEPSDKDGVIALSNLDEGLYYLRDTSVDASGYRFAPFFVRIPPESEEKTDIYPKREGERPEVKLLKISEENKPLAGAVFELYQKLSDDPKDENREKRVPLTENRYDPEGSIEERLTTDAKGEILIENLPAGKYIFREVQAPAGYKVINRDTVFELAVGESKVVKIVNKKDDHRGGYRFLKIDGATNKPLSGASFRVTHKVGKAYKAVQRDKKDYVVTSDEKGMFSVDGLAYGTYYLWEIKAPKGYDPLNGSVSFKVTEQSETRRITIKNERAGGKSGGGSSSGGERSSGGSSAKRGKIPKTGDITLIILAAAGIALALAGVRLVKNDIGE